MKETEEIEEPYLIDTSKETLKEQKERFFQIDVLKAVMIFLVIFDHFVDWDVKNEIGVALWERISIPVFLVIMGFNMGRSFQNQGDLSLKELYSWSYFKRKILRYIVPFLILYAVSTFIGLFMYGFDLSAMWNNQYSPDHGFIHLFIGFLPFWGPGNWFLPVLFQSILIMPLLYKAFTKNRTFTLILCFVVEIIMQLLVFAFIGDITSEVEFHYWLLFLTSVLIYLPGIGLGMWFSFGYHLKSKRNIFMWILLPLSLVYIYYHQFRLFRFRIGDVLLLQGDYHLLIVPYSAFLFLLALKIFPQKSENGFSRAIALIGKSTYHILLIQIFGYGMIYAFWGDHYGIFAGFSPDKIIDMVVLWIFFISFGVLWYKTDQNKDLKRRTLYYINLFIVFASILFLSFWAQSFWIPIPLVIIIIYAIIALITHFIIEKPLTIKTLGLWTLFLLITFIMLVLQVEVLQPSEFIISYILIGVFLIFALIGTFSEDVSLRDVRDIKWFWGFIYLFSAIFTISVGLWKFTVYLEHSYILLFQVWEYIVLIYSIIITLVALKAAYTSFYYADEKPIKWYIKVMILASVLFYAYNIHLAIEIITRW
jgi:peptidoglycan/LPS O-acetylase OafA/YrhL